MTVPVGGLRERLIMESVHVHLKSGLTELGWFTRDPNRKDLVWLNSPVVEGEHAEPNTVAVFSDRLPPQIDLELGSDLGENHWQWFADVYAEDEAVGLSLSGDIRDILRGRMPSAGASQPILDVYDFRLATPVVVIQCDIENVSRDRPPTFSRGWQQFFFTVPFTIVDTYRDEHDDTGDLVFPDDNVYPSA